MKKHYLDIFSMGNLIGLIILVFTLNSCAETNSERDYYQIKVYHLKDKVQVDQVESYLRDSYLPALHRAGISKVGVFKLVEPDTITGHKIFVWTPFKSLLELNEIPRILKNDEQFQSGASDYINSPHDAPPYGRIESILLYAFSEMPNYGAFKYDTPHDMRVYELRSYQAATEKLLDLKVEMFNEGGEVKIFQELGFNPLFFGKVISGNTMPNLMYMSTFADKDSQADHWEDFGMHPDWQVLKKMEKYQNTVSKIEKFLLYPTNYSDI